MLTVSHLKGKSTWRAQSRRPLLRMRSGFRVRIRNSDLDLDDFQENNEDFFFKDTFTIKFS